MDETRKGLLKIVPVEAVVVESWEREIIPAFDTSILALH
jgi:hypothetical protein